ncbi:tyrosine-type recombinase/integrase [Priestia koreensis]|uniref:Recombinase n=1 Tax=Priestia koreensis TaxID=284581 RepID=A0A0M0L6X5_9BACI|nr:tyrosine-type recombinase/integrase [Priestia koreensis]KOO46418.1 recombinase [Priestia koreensis]
MHLTDLVEEYCYHCMAKGFTKKTMINKRQELKQVLKFLREKRGIEKLENVTTHDLKAYIRQKQSSGLQVSSIRSMHKTVAAFFNWCMLEEYSNENLMKKVECPKAKEKILTAFTEDEVYRMINCFSYENYIESRNKAIIAMLADCGLRAMEIRTLKNSDIKETSIHVSGKGGKERVVYISPALKKILIKYERLKTKYFKDKIIHDRYFLSYAGRELSHVGLDNLVKLAGKRARVNKERVSPHMFRHFFAVQSLASGNLDVYSLSRLLGHADISVTQRYLHTLSIGKILEKAKASSPLMTMGRK